MRLVLLQLVLILVVAHRGLSQATVSTTAASQNFLLNPVDGKSTLNDVSHPVNRIIESYLIVDAKAIELLQQRGVSAAQLASALDDMITLTNALLIDVKIWLVIYGIEYWHANSTWPINYTFVTVDRTVALDGNAVIKTLGDYRVEFLIKQRNLSVDHVHLLTGYSIAVNNRFLVGLSVYNSVCSRLSSTIVSVPRFVYNVYDGRNFAESLAIATTHEIGHTLNLYHDIRANISRNSSITLQNSTARESTIATTEKSSCECYDSEPGQCVMWPRGRHREFQTVSWTACTKAQLLQPIPTYPRDVCFTNKPEFASFAPPKCGDFVLDKGEQCDCGPAYVCQVRIASHCCNASSCQLHSRTARCASGACCNLTSCSFSAASVCRVAAGECDIPEFCDGSSAACPVDTWKTDGTPCANDTGYCFMGKCRTLERQCKQLSATGVQVSPARNTCVRLAHCKHRSEKMMLQNGLNATFSYSSESNCSADYFPAEDESYGCTRIACQSELVANNSRCTNLTTSVYPFLNLSLLDAISVDELRRNASYCCYSVDQGPQFELGTFLAKRDMRLVEDGTKCGQSKMCLNQICRSIDSLVQSKVIKRCDSLCPSGQICNNLGKCQIITVGQEPQVRNSTDLPNLHERGLPYRKNIIIVSICIPIVAVGAVLIVLAIYWRNHPLQKCHPQSASKRVKNAAPNATATADNKPRNSNSTVNLKNSYSNEMSGMKLEKIGAQNFQEATGTL